MCPGQQELPGTASDAKGSANIAEAGTMLVLQSLHHPEAT